MTIPSMFYELGPGGLMWWQWIGLGALSLGAILAGSIAAYLIRSVLRRIVARSAVTWDDQLLERTRHPLRMVSAIAIARLALPVLDLPGGARTIAIDVLILAISFGLTWTVLVTIDIAVAQTARAAWALERPSSRSLLLLGGRIIKVVVIAVALIAFLGSLGVPIASLVAGLGIGGIALAFGAQKTVENLFGAFSLGVDQPLREGDFVRVEDQVLGTVEHVGLRSTRFRTLDRTVVTLPNGKLADLRIETYALRDRCRLSTTIGLVYSTTRAQLERVMSAFEDALRNHPAIWPDDFVVRFSAFGVSSLDIEIMAWFKTADWGQFRIWRQEILFEFMQAVEAAGTRFALPTRTIHVESLPSPRP
ncbi:MAG: mechanosensitive ion channel family protein [Kofleriaceae bacterium]